MKYTIDASNKKLGRVATEAAVLLMGKNTPEFVRNVAPNVEVHVINTSHADVSGKKMDEKTYSQFSGYPGGLKQPTMKQVVAKKGMSEVFRKAIKGMLPHNKLQAVMMKNLTITE